MKLPAASTSGIEPNENQLFGRQMVITCSLAFGDVTLPTCAVIDSGCTGFALLDANFARHHLIPQAALKRPRPVQAYDGAEGSITHIAKAALTIGEHRETLPMFVIKSGRYPLILGIPWLCHHDVAIHFASGLITFGSQFCLAHCTAQPTTVKAIQGKPPLLPTGSRAMPAGRARDHVESASPGDRAESGEWRIWDCYVGLGSDVCLVALYDAVMAYVQWPHI